MYNMYKIVIITWLFLVPNFNHKLENICRNAIRRSVSTFEKDIKSSKFKIDSIDFSYRNSREVNGIIYYLKKKYTVFLYTDQHFNYKDKSLYDSLIKTNIVQITLQKSNPEDIEIFE